MIPLRICLASNVFIPMGGASKCAGLLFQHLDRRLFDPCMLSGSDMTAFAVEYGIPEDRYAVCDMTDVKAVSSALKGCDVVFLLVASSDTVNEYAIIWAAAERAGVKLRVLRCVFGLGVATPSKADLFLCYSMEGFLAGQSCMGCFVAYPAVPRHAQAAPRAKFRREFGIQEDAFVVAYACADQRHEFYEVAAAFKRSDVVFLSALSRPDLWSVPPNVRFCGILGQRQMPSLYDASDVVLHARTESFGYAVHQGVAAEKPIIALWTSSKNAFAETIWPGGGYLARDAPGAVAALEHVYRNREEATARARTALARAERLAPEIQVPRFEALILRRLYEKDVISSDVMDICPRAEHWPGPAEIFKWVRSRSEIEAELRKSPFV